MSTLVPGPIFITSGFNRNSTPTPPNTTPSQLDDRYRRVDFNGHDWPRESPISRAYDVANTSTKLIILNNKYGKNGTRLRGYYTGPKRPERHVDPNRHRAESPRNPRFHSACLDSSSPKFEPTVKSDLEWINSSHRPPNALIGALLSLSDDYSSELDAVSIGRKSGRADSISINLSSVFEMPLDKPVTVEKPKKRQLLKARTSVNPRRHTTCQAPPELPVHPDRPRSRMSIPPNKYFTNSEYADMSMGEKIYMWSIEKIYNMDKMKQLKQEQYKKLLNMEAKKGYHGYQEYVKYMRYINSAKDRSHGTGTPSDKRSRSAYSPRSQRSKSATSRSSPTKSESRSEEDMENDKVDQHERPKTSQGHSRQEPLNDTKTSDEDTKKRTASAGSSGQRSIGSQRSQTKSPSPSRKSSAKSSASGSQRSLRSKSGSRASSAVSTKSAEKTKVDHSDSSLSAGDDDVPQLHKEGKDRPKSRLGHPGIAEKDQSKAEGEETHIHQEGKDRPKSRLGHPGGDDKDQDSLHSSTLSIKSDNSSLSSDSGVENGGKGKKTKQSSDTSSLSSVENTNRRRINQDKKTQNKQNKMGSRSSVSSKSSSRSGNENFRSGNQSKGNKSNVEAARKEKTEHKVQEESPDNDTKVHRIPSGTFVAEEVTTDKNTGEERVNADTVTSNYVEKQEEDNQVQIDSSKEAEDKSEDTTNDKLGEVENKTEEESGKEEVKAEEQQLDQNDKENIAESIENKDKTKEKDSEPQDQDENKNVTDDKGRNKLNRQDSFEEEDEDRRMNKDLDQIEY